MCGRSQQVVGGEHEYVALRLLRGSLALFRQRMQCGDDHRSGCRAVDGLCAQCLESLGVQGYFPAVRIVSSALTVSTITLASSNMTNELASTSNLAVRGMMPRLTF